MTNSQEFYSRILLHLLAWPPTLCLFLLGATLLLGAWAAARHWGMFLFAGLACVKVALAVVLTRFFLTGRSIAADVAAELRAEARRAREHKHEQLAEALSRDGDGQARLLLADLRGFEKALELMPESALCDSALLQMRMTALELLERCYATLHETHRLWTIALQISIPAARETLFRQRDHAVQQVRLTVQPLAKALDEIQRFTDQITGDSQIATISAELESALETAKQVRAAIANCEHGASRETGPKRRCPSQRRAEPMSQSR